MRYYYRQDNYSYLCKQLGMTAVPVALPEKKASAQPVEKKATQRTVIRHVNVDEAALIRASASYRIGRFITFIPRKIRGGVRCYREHGWRYTWQRVLVHLGVKEDPYK